MTVQFAFKNIAVNTLLGFAEPSKIEEWIEYKAETGYKYKDKFYFERNVESFKETIPNFENEFLQLVSTTNQASIDYYFAELKAELLLIEERFSIDYIKALINESNDKEIKLYNEKG